ncbi:MAG: flavin reductase [Firmicutes bacterium]|nr:flavin reductase [Bacillota bacterium]
MHCTRKVQEDLYWVGANDRRLSLFEGVYAVPKGVSYNSYLLLDEKTVLFDTVDQAVSQAFFENIRYALAGRDLDYVVIQHMEPDHSATLGELLCKYPQVRLVCNEKIAVMIQQYFDVDVRDRALIVKEGDTFSSGKHTFAFVMAPMVHWPEVMVTYDQTDRILFSADAFGTFGALNGALFADEVDFYGDYMDEARRYYCNIVGKYGQQVQALLQKAAGLDIEMICPLHGFVHRKHLGDFIEKYQKWSAYIPEEKGVMIAYASVYGHTENAADILACRLRDKGVPTVMFDVSVTPASEIIAAAFRYSHLVFASTTYNAGVFVSMDELLRDLAAHNLQNRTVAIVQNGSWAPASGKLMKEILSTMKNITFIEQDLTLKSALKESQEEEIEALTAAIAADFPGQFANAAAKPAAAGTIDNTAMFKLSYGLFVLTLHEEGKDSGCIINTAIQIADKPKRISFAVNKANYSHDMLMRTGVFNISILSEDVPFSLFRHFGFQSGRDTDKFADWTEAKRSANGVYYITQATNAFISGKIVAAVDNGSHTLFTADITEAQKLSDVTSITYDYYFKHVKPKPQPTAEKKKGFVCKICGYVYEGDVLPPDFICPLCKHGAEDFEPLS